MSMSGTALGDAVATAIEGLDSSFTPAQKATLKTAQEAIYLAVVTYITANMVVNPGTLAVSAATITAPSGGGPCTGLGTITGSGTVS